MKINVITEDELFRKFGYLMDDSHGRDVELLMDILICNGIEVKEVEEGYLINMKINLKYFYRRSRLNAGFLYIFSHILIIHKR